MAMHEITAVVPAPATGWTAWSQAAQVLGRYFAGAV